MPENKENQHALSEGSRRSFIVKLWYGLGFVALLECIGVVTAFLFPGKRRVIADDYKTVIEAGPAEKFPLDSVTAFIRGKFYLVRLADGGFLALSRKCTHLGCTVPWVSKEKKFVCPCHSSTFDIRGAVVSPPAPRALDIYHIFIENRIVKVDTGKKIKRAEFRPEHVIYPKSV
jgi:cytochrome b6-f complex iron-sulfur subunit